MTLKIREGIAKIPSTTSKTTRKDPRDSFKPFQKQKGSPRFFKTTKKQKPNKGSLRLFKLLQKPKKFFKNNLITK